VTNEEEQSPGVAHWRGMLKTHREILKLAQEMAAQAQAELADAFNDERVIEDRLMIEKCEYLNKLARGEAGNTDEATGKPKRKRKSRRS